LVFPFAKNATTRFTVRPERSPLHLRHIQQKLYTAYEMKLVKIYVKSRTFDWRLAYDTNST